MNKSLLIVDDDALVAKVYSAKFTQAGFNVLVAPSGELALKLVKESPPDVVLLDLQLPDLPGVDVLHQIREMEGALELPVIVFSSTYLSTAIQAAWKAGATKCLSKANCTPSQIVAIVKGMLQSKVPGVPGASTSIATPPSAAAHDTAVDTDPAFTASLQRDFIASLPVMLNALRARVQVLNKSVDEVQRSQNLEGMHRAMHSLINNASVAGLVHIANFGEAMEALFKELYEKPRQFTPSTLRTIAVAVDFLGVLFSHGELMQGQDDYLVNIMVVDDERLSRRAILYALEKARLKATEIDNPRTAYQKLADGYFDLIFLDVDMPDMTGFDLCARLRALPKYKQTPVVFVTSLNDFESRAQSTISGGNDLIAKPFLFVELAVKALVYVLRARINAAKQATDKSDAQRFDRADRPG